MYHMIREFIMYMYMHMMNSNIYCYATKYSIYMGMWHGAYFSAEYICTYVYVFSAALNMIYTALR